MTELVLTQQRDHIFEIILNRPDKRNAINMELFRQFDTAVTPANNRNGRPLSSPPTPIPSSPPAPISIFGGRATGCMGRGWRIIPQGWRG